MPTVADFIFKFRAQQLKAGSSAIRQRGELKRWALVPCSVLISLKPEIWLIPAGTYNRKASIPKPIVRRSEQPLSLLHYEIAEGFAHIRSSAADQIRSTIHISQNSFSISFAPSFKNLTAFLETVPIINFDRTNFSRRSRHQSICARLLKIFVNLTSNTQPID